jgi:hypothetical protein
VKIKYYNGKNAINNERFNIVKHFNIVFNDNHWVDIQITQEFAIWGFWKDRNYTLLPKPKWWQVK